MRWDINWGEHHLSKPGWELDVTWMKLIYRSSEIDGRETRPGRRWDPNVGTRMELRCEPNDPDGGQVVYGRKRCKYIGIRIQMRQDLHGVEDISWNLCEFEMVAAWIWDAIVRTWDGGETYIFNPAWAWDGAWVELRCNLWTWMEVRCHQDGGEMEI